MPTSPSIQERLPLSHSSANNNLKCTTTITSYDKRSENAMKKSLKRHLHRGHAFLHKSLQKPIIVQAHKTGRRRYTFSGYQDSKLVYKKRRRFTSIACPTKFLLGGSRTDPLNLKSLEDEEVNQQLNAFSPASSPMPIPTWRSQVQVVIPPNIYDPLNLNSGEEIRFNLLSKSRKRRRHRKSRREEHEMIIENKELSQTDVSSVEQEKQLQDIGSPPNTKENDSEIGKEQSLPFEEASEKVESVSIDNSSIKLTLDTSKELEEKTSVEKPVLKRRRSKTRIQKADTIRFRANAEKFCYGNHLISHHNWNFYRHNEDPRIGFLSEELFREKKVLDIGCNSGDLTLFIAKNYQPQSVTALDIDKKLVNIAQRKLRRETEDILGLNAPQSLAVLYGSLSKVLQLIPRTPYVFPDNVTFLEANYVPPSEDYLETQKPEYDTILCLRVTKWIHLNFGDEGLKLVFKRMYAQLRMGGHLILEPQPWFTYSASKRITPAIYKTYCSLQMRPDSFCDYLLSSEVGFRSCELLGRSINYAKGYRQNIYLLTKPYEDGNKGLLNNGLSPIPFHDDQWTSNEDNYDATLDCLEASSEYSDTNIQI